MKMVIIFGNKFRTSLNNARLFFFFAKLLAALNNEWWI